MKINTMKKDECCGCGACAASCSKSAIMMQEDQDGFLYPVINPDLCINCGKCERTCKFRNGVGFPPLSLKKTYIAISDSTNILESASGGIFSGIAKCVLNNGGIVYGCALNRAQDGFAVQHIRIADEQDLYLLKGSKYVQSDMTKCYGAVQKDLKEGKVVLFSGTACQVAGVKGFLGKEYENLYTIEIVCHGVPSVRFFNDYIHDYEKRLGGSIADFRFRDKNQGWQLLGKVTYNDDEGNTKVGYLPPEESSYYQMFLNGYTYRESCYKCPYASEHRAGDVTIGDYWCIDLVHPELLVTNGGEICEKDGVSCLITNNAHGSTLIDLYGDGIKKWQSTYEKAAKYNAQLLHPSLPKDERDTVFSLYEKGYAHVESWYQRRLRVVKLKRYIISLVPKRVKRAIKRVLGKTGGE